MYCILFLYTSHALLTDFAECSYKETQVTLEKNWCSKLITFPLVLDTKATILSNIITTTSITTIINIDYDITPETGINPSSCTLTNVSIPANEQML